MQYVPYYQSDQSYIAHRRRTIKDYAAAVESVVRRTVPPHTSVAVDHIGCTFSAVFAFYALLQTYLVARLRFEAGGFEP